MPESANGQRIETAPALMIGELAARLSAERLDRERAGETRPLAGVGSLLGAGSLLVARLRSTADWGDPSGT